MKLVDNAIMVGEIIQVDILGLDDNSPQKMDLTYQVQDRAGVGFYKEHLPDNCYNLFGNDRYIDLHKPFIEIFEYGVRRNVVEVRAFYDAYIAAKGYVSSRMFFGDRYAKSNVNGWMVIPMVNQMQAILKHIQELEEKNLQWYAHVDVQYTSETKYERF
jgi:hypothetical protein